MPILRKVVQGADRGRVNLSQPRRAMGLSEGGQKRRANLVFGMFHLPYFVLHSLLKFFSRAFAALSERLTNRGQFHHRYFVQIVDWFAGEPLDDGDATFPHCASAWIQS